MNNNPTESLTLDAVIEYLEDLAESSGNSLVLADLHRLREIRSGYKFDVPQTWPQ